MLRRRFLKACIDGLGGLVTGTLALPGLRFLFDPLRRGRTETGFVRVARLEDIPAAAPMRVAVVADRWDGYVHHPPGPVGNVWLVPESSKAAGGVLSNETPRVVTDLGAQQTTGLKCYQTICPHLGCGTDFDAARGRFVCPCHASDFDLSGRVLSGPSPRGLDELACRISGPAPDGARWVEVEYREFKTGTAERERLI